MLSRLAQLAVVSAALLSVSVPRVSAWCAIDSYAWTNGQPSQPVWVGGASGHTTGLNGASGGLYGDYSWYNYSTVGTGTSTSGVPSGIGLAITGLTGASAPSTSAYTIHGQTFPGIVVNNECSAANCDASNMWLTWESEYLSNQVFFQIIINDYYLKNNGQWTSLNQAPNNEFPTSAFTVGNYAQSSSTFQTLITKTQSAFPTDAALISVAVNGVCPTVSGYTVFCNDPTQVGKTVPFSQPTIAGRRNPNLNVNSEPFWAIRAPNFNCADKGVNYVIISDSYTGSSGACFSQPGYSCVVNNCPSTPTVRGDPQFAGLRGQDYQVHGIDGGVYNVISDKHMQLNSKFVFLTGPRPCPIMPSTGVKSVACFAHAGSYLQNLALLTSADDKLLIESGSAASGLSSVSLNGEELTVGQVVQLTFADGRQGYIAYNSTHEVTLKAGLFEMEVESSDAFLNLRSVRVSGADWSELKEEKAHGLLGQTWQLRKGQSAIEGKVDDYLLESEDLFGTDFMYNRFGVVDSQSQ